MTLAADALADAGAPPTLLTELLPTCRDALGAAEALQAAAKRAVAGEVAPEGRVEAARMDEHQFAAHGLAWVATYVESLRQMLG